MIRAATLLLLAIAAVGPAKERDPLAGRVAGKPAECISLSHNSSPTIIDRRTILYRESGRRVWRTGPIGECPALRPMNTLIIEVFGNQLCRNDRFRVLEPNAGIPSGVCRFDRFTPYDKVR